MSLMNIPNLLVPGIFFWHLCCGTYESWKNVMVANLEHWLLLSDVLWCLPRCIGQMLILVFVQVSTKEVAQYLK
jgi:hypothetical protein